MKDAAYSYGKELRDMGLTDLNKWPGYFMRRFNLTYADAVATADGVARYVEAGKYARPKKIRKEPRHERDTD